MTDPNPTTEAPRIIAYACPECGSENMVGDAAVLWDAEAQEWGISNVYDQRMTCQDCGSENYGVELVDDGTLQQCGVCDTIQREEDMLTQWPDIPDLGERVYPGEAAPTGTCGAAADGDDALDHKCRGLCHPYARPETVVPFLKLPKREG